LIEDGITNGNGVVSLGEGVYAATHVYNRIRLPIELCPNKSWVDVKEMLNITVNDSDSQAILYKLDHDDYDVIVLVDGSGARWIKKWSGWE